MAEQIKQIIKNIVNLRPGIGNVQLVLDVMTVVNPVCLFENQYQEELKSLIENKEILEIEYIRPNMDYRIKSVYFPAGTKFINMEFTR